MKAMGIQRVVWVEIVEPRTHERMYANLHTGECLWDPPEDTPVKQATDDQWWELFDDKTQRFYYYNAPTETTVWHRPDGADIIPLSKLQTVKNNKGAGGPVKTRSRRSLTAKSNKTNSTITTGSAKNLRDSNVMQTSSEDENPRNRNSSYEQHKKRQRSSRHSRKSLVEENRRSKNATGWSSTNLLSNDASLDSTESKPKLPKLNVTAPAEVLADERSQGVGMRKKSKSMLNSEKRQSNLAKSPSCPTPGSRPISGIKTSQPRSYDSKIDEFARTNLNVHKRGLLRKKITIHTMLSWTRDPIKKPMIMTKDKQIKKEACEVFRWIQAFMGDRKLKRGHHENIAHEIVSRGWRSPDLRDEIFIQLCRQTTANPKPSSLKLGWELMCMCLHFFPPSNKFHSYLEGYIYTHLTTADQDGVQISYYATISFKRLAKITETGAKRGRKKPAVDEVNQSQHSIFNPSLFGCNLVDVMEIQAEKYPELKLPWVMTSLAQKVFDYNGDQAEGIFRVPGDIDEVNMLKFEIDNFNVPTSLADPNVFASCLKFWYRELEDPLIPNEFYEECINRFSDVEYSIGIVEKLPRINKMCLVFLIKFLQVFALPHNIERTKMDASNLAMVWAPNCLRCQSEIPKVIFENTRKEMSYIKTLILHLDTSWIDGVK